MKSHFTFLYSLLCLINILMKQFSLAINFYRHSTPWVLSAKKAKSQKSVLINSSHMLIFNNQEDNWISWALRFFQTPIFPVLMRNCKLKHRYASFSETFSFTLNWLKFSKETSKRQKQDLSLHKLLICCSGTLTHDFWCDKTSPVRLMKTLWWGCDF